MVVVLRDDDARLERDVEVQVVLAVGLDLGGILVRLDPRREHVFGDLPCPEDWVLRFGDVGVRRVLRRRRQRKRSGCQHGDKA